MPTPRRNFLATNAAATNSVRGVMYDMKHSDELPPSVNGESPMTVYKFVATRDNRSGYLLYFVALIVTLFLLILYIMQISRRLRVQQPRPVYLTPVPAARNAFI